MMITGFKSITVILASFFFMTDDIYGADGFGGSATGGAGGTTVTVGNLADFQYYATRSTPYIVRVSGTISLDGIGGKLQPASNKTIEGVDHNATVIGRIDLHTGCNNVIIRNLNITSPANDGISVWGATNIFITHCNIYDCYDGSIDINNSADNVTVSWCRFSYRNPAQPGHCFVSIADNAHITFHHNWYDYGCDQRMPASTGGTIHMYNNYFSCTGNYYCSNARNDARILSESNYYDHVNSPIGISSGTTGLIKTIGNIYDSCTGTIHPGTDSVFTPTYSYAPDAVADVPAIVMAGAGNRLYGDYNGDKSVDAEDLYLFVDFWMNNDRWPAFYQDLNDDGLINLYEFKSFAQNWLRMD